MLSNKILTVILDDENITMLKFRIVNQEYYYYCNKEDIVLDDDKGVIYIKKSFHIFTPGRVVKEIVKHFQYTKNINGPYYVIKLKRGIKDIDGHVVRKYGERIPSSAGPIVTHVDSILIQDMGNLETLNIAHKNVFYDDVVEEIKKDFEHVFDRIKKEQDEKIAEKREIIKTKKKRFWQIWG
jgi:hypothetical protein